MAKRKVTQSGGCPKLRGYQERAVQHLLALLKRKRRVVAVAPTGSGKTVIGAALIRKLRDKRVLWLAHRVELLKQAYAQLLAAGVPERDLGILSDREKRNIGARILIASIGVFRSRVVPRVDLMVVDEAHRSLAASYLALVAKVPRARLLGLTATPVRLDGQPLVDAFDRLEVIAGQTELIVDGYIAKPITYGVPLERAKQLVAGVETDHHEYKEAELARVMLRRTLLGDVVRECARLAPGEKTIVFAVNREHGKALARRFKRARRATEYLDGETPAAERRDMLERLKAGATEVVVNVDVLSEGFDCPPVKCIVLARPTRSLTRYLQQVGRAARPYGNKRPIILDHAGNVWRFGLPDAEREWSIDGPRKAAVHTGDALLKMCSACEAMIPRACLTCPECGAEQEIDAREVTQTAAELERMAATETELGRRKAALVEIAKERGLGRDWVESVLSTAA